MEDPLDGGAVMVQREAACVHRTREPIEMIAQAEKRAIEHMDDVIDAVRTREAPV